MEADPDSETLFHPEQLTVQYSSEFQYLSVMVKAYKCNISLLESFRTILILCLSYKRKALLT
jgi:hypothetical protein